MTDDICGISENFNDENIQPLNGLRHNETQGSSGWFFWRGEYSDKDDFFKSAHLSHLKDILPDDLVTLPPGHRFLIDTKTGYRDVWFDKELLNTL